MTDEKYFRATIILYDTDLEIIDAADTNDAGRSATIRKIIREWASAQRQARTLIDTPAEYHARAEGE